MSDERFDAKIDEAAQAMTRGDLPPDFRARVMARIERGDEVRWTWPPTRGLAPLALAAVLLLAVLVVRAPWRSADSDGSHTGSEGHRIASSEAAAIPAIGRKPEAMDAANPLKTASFNRMTSAERRSAVALRPDATDEGGLASDLAPPPIHIESLEVEAMASLNIAPLGDDGMESIDVPRLEIAPLDLPAIGEQ